jgi:hypothetical protein
MAARYAAKREKAQTAMRHKTGEEADRAKVPKELKDTLKKSKGAKPLLQELEQEIRTFVEKWEEKQQRLGEDDFPEPDSEDEEIVFVGRSGQMHDRPSPRNSGELKREKLLFQSSLDDRGASFGFVSSTSKVRYHLAYTCQSLACSPYRHILWSQNVVSHRRQSRQA